MRTGTKPPAKVACHTASCRTTQASDRVHVNKAEAVGSGEPWDQLLVRTRSRVQQVSLLSSSAYRASLDEPHEAFTFVASCSTFRDIVVEVPSFLDLDMAAGVASLPPHHLLSNYADINVCAPMVRYSKLPFRALVAQYDTHITTTPMILATEFSRHPQARDADFSTNASERGSFELVPVHGATSKSPVKVRGSLVCQLAASEPDPLADAAELVSPFVDGIDLNCGWYVRTG